MNATILGCGVAGSWLAHALVMLGCEELVLFDGGADSEHTRNVGPFRKSFGKQSTAAHALADYLMQLNPNLRLETYGNFDPDKDMNRVKGLVVGAMSEIQKCMKTGEFAAERKMAFVTLGLPVHEGERIRFGTSGAVLREGHFGGPTIASKSEIALAAFQALQPFF